MHVHVAHIGHSGHTSKGDHDVTAKPAGWKKWMHGLTGIQVAPNSTGHHTHVFKQHTKKYKPMSRLSPDDLTLILRHLTIQDLTRVTRTCRILRHIGEQLLYGHRDIDLSRYPNRLQMFLRTLANRPDLAKHVRTAVLASSYIPDRRRVYHDEMEHDHMQEEEHHELERFVFKQLRNVDCLKIISGYTTRDCHESAIRNIVNTEYKLRTLRYTGRLTYSTTSPDLCNVVEMLRHQRSLDHLELRTTEDLDFYEDDARTDLRSHVPNLRTFIGRPWAASQIVPGRPVSTLGFIVSQDDFGSSSGHTSMAFARALKGSTTPVKEIVLEYDDAEVARHQVLKELAQLAPALQVLRVKVNAEMDSKHRDRIMDLVQEIKESMRYIPNLHEIDLSGNRMLCPKYEDVFLSRVVCPFTPKQLHTIANWCEASEGLERVTLPNGKVWRRH